MEEDRRRRNCFQKGEATTQKEREQQEAGKHEECLLPAALLRLCLCFLSSLLLYSVAFIWYFKQPCQPFTAMFTFPFAQSVWVPFSSSSICRRGRVEKTMPQEPFVFLSELLDACYSEIIFLTLNLPCFGGSSLQVLFCNIHKVGVRLIISSIDISKFPEVLKLQKANY